MSDREIQHRRKKPAAVRTRPETASGVRSGLHPLGDHQAAIGNLELLDRLTPRKVQTKLRVSEPGDAHEREADRLADAVMGMPAAALQRQAEEEEEVVQTKLEVHRQEQEEEETVQTKGEIARQAEEEEDSVQTRQEVHRQEQEEEETAQPKGEIARQAEEEEEVVQTKLGVHRQETEEEEAVQTRQEVDRQEEEEEALQAKAENAVKMTPAVESGINRSRGGGHPLDASTRGFFEPRFGRKLSEVKVHTDSHAARLAGQLNAQAFTVGRDVYFAGGKYQPGTESGRSLLAHELTHTIQQQPGAKLADRPAGPDQSRLSLTRANRQVQRTNGGTETSSTTPTQAAIPEEAGTVNEAEHKIIYPTLKLADFKAQGHRGAKYNAQTIKRARNFARGNPDQTSVWDASITDRVIEDKLKDKLASTFEPGDPSKTYVLKHGQSGYYLIGTLSQMVGGSKRPIWDPRGNPRPKDVDHMVELQISGWPDAGWANEAGENGNMELLDSQANQDSGRRIMREVGRLVKVSRENYWKRPSDPAGAATGTDANFWVKSRQPSLKSIKERYDLVFTNVSTGLGQAGQPENHWQWKEIAEETKHLDDFTPDTQGFESGAWTIFPDAAGGMPKRLAHTNGADQAPRARDVRGWFNPFEVRQINLVDPGTLPANAATDIGSITLGLPRGSGRTPYGFNLNQPIPLRRFPGLPNAAYLDAQGLSAVWRALTIRGLSPIEIQSWTLAPDRGMQARGTLLPSIPIFAELGIDLVIDGDELRLSKVFDIGEFNLPGPIEVTDSSLEVFAGTRGIGARGEVGLGIEGVGQGRIEARVDTEGGFALSGTFTFDPELFDPPSQIRMGYANGEFSGSGTLTIGENRVRGIKTASITVTYEQGVLTATGNAELDVPGLERGTMTLTYSEEEGFAIGGTFNLSSDVPGIRSGSVSAEVRQRPEGEGYMVSASGTAVPDIPGVDARVSVSFEDGIFTAEATAQYSRGMLAGELHLGATNRPVDEQGNPGEGPTPELRAFGGGSLTLTLAPWLAATAAVRLTPEGEVEVTGRIGLPSALEVFPARRYDRNIFSINLDIPIVGVAVAGQRIGIFATIGGGLDLTAGFGPGQLRDLHLQVTYNPDHEDQTRVEGGAEFFVPADAGLRLFVRGALGAGIPIVSATAGIEIGGQLGIEGAVRAAVEVSWTPTQGIDLQAEAEIFAEPKFKFDITGFVLVEADLLLTTIELYSQRWQLAQFEYGSGLRLGATFPIHYREGEPFDVSIDDIEFQVPDINPRELLSDLVDRIA